MIQYQLQQFKVPLKKKDQLSFLLSKYLKVSTKDIKNLRIDRLSLDSRKKNNLYWVYNISFSTPKKLPRVKGLVLLDQARKQGKQESIRVDVSEQVHVVGSGPCGLWAALHLVQKGFKVVLHERGSKVEERFKLIRHFFKQAKLNPHTNVLYGEGGAGAFSDGKLTSRTRNEYTKTVLEDMVSLGGTEDVTYHNKPHIGTDKLQFLVKNMRDRLIELGVDYRFNSYLQDIDIQDNAIQAIQVNDKWIPCETLVLAVGHSSRETYEMLYERGVFMEAKDFALGVRVEHPQEFINVRQYGGQTDFTCSGAAEYVLKGPAGVQEKELPGAYSFCMCPGGVLIPCSSQEGMFATNGMSYSRRSAPFSNSGIVVPIQPNEEDIFAGVKQQEALEKLAFEIGGKNYGAPAQHLDDFMEGRVTSKLKKTSYPCDVVSYDHNEFFDPNIVESLKRSFEFFERKIPGFIKKGVMLSPETRTSSPLRITRDNETLESVNVKGLFPLGEGAGYSGGIVSSAADGVRFACIVRKKHD